MLKSRVVLLAVVCSIAVGIPGWAACPVGDINGDCRVAWEDLALVADDWLMDGAGGTDLDDDGVVALRDLGILAFHWQRSGIPLAINECMAANSSFVPDRQGEFDDWIEIYNPGDEPIDAGGMYLTDDLSDPARWRIPVNHPVLTTIPPGGFILIWADTDTTDAGLHASFELDAGGEELALFESDGISLIDWVAFGEQVGDISYGRFPNAADDWRFMVFPTPGGPNAGAYEGAVADTKFSHDRGFYEEPFEVAITCATAGAVIYYSTDGSEPYVEGARFATGNVYRSPIPITRTTCLRAVAVKPGWMPSNVDTHTYIFLGDVITRSQSQVLAEGYPDKWYSSFPADYEMDPEVCNDPQYADLMDDALLAIPTVSLVTTKNYLFGRTNNADSGGIYIYTGHSSTGGQGWERPVSAEMFTPDGEKEFQVNCGIRIQGGENRKPQKCPKHSMSLRFRSKYGPSQFEFPLFHDGPVERFDSFQFRGGFNNTWTHWSADQRERTQYIRDQWMRDSLLEMGQADAGRGYFVHLYINGIYWGLYDLQERPVASHYAAYNGGDEEDIDAINGGSPTDGTAQAWQKAKSIVATRDWNRIREVIDIDNFIDWTLLNLFAGNTDLKNNGNWRAAGGGPERRPWRFYSWDGEHVMESLSQSGTRPSDDPTGMFRYLDDIEEFRVRFGDRVHKHLFNNGALTSQRNAERWRTRADEINLAVIAESARWGDYRRDMHSYSSGPYRLYTRNEFWIPQKNWLLNEYFPRRTDVALDQFKSRGLYPGVDAPTFNINGSYQHGGYVAAGAALSMSGAGGAVWFTLDGSDPRLSGSAPDPGDDITLVAEGAAKRVLVPSSPVSDAWRGGQGFNDSAWISGAGGVGYERSSGYQPYFDIDVQSQMYGSNTTCYIRIPFSVSGDDMSELSNLILKVRYDDGFVAYLNGYEVQRVQCSGEPAWNSSASAIHSDVDAVNFETFNVGGHLDKLRQGQNVLALQGLNVSSTSSDFLISVELVSSKAPAGAVESGVSPTAVRYSGPISLQHSGRLKARALTGGTWSALNEAVFAAGPVAESLRISEIMYHPGDTGSPDDPNTEYVELTNMGDETINLNLVSFTNGIDFAFGSLELAPGDYCLVVKDAAAFEAKYGAGLNIAGQYAGSLNNGGERVELQDAAGAVIHDFRYDDNWFDLTDGGGFSLTVRDPLAGDLDSKSAWRPSANVGGSPGYDDAGGVPELGAVVINEVLANSTGGEPDWIELHNTTNQAIDIGGWFLSDEGDNLTKYEIAAGVTLPAGGYLVFDQDRHFDNDDDPGCHDGFALSRDGETVYLHSGAGGLTGYSEQEKFDASDPGVSLGRYLKSTGTYNFVALSVPTPGAENAYPHVGPVVITEIMYHPDEAGDAEYVELLNISDAAVTLYDAVRDAPWRFTDDPDDPGVEFLFPTDPPVTLAPGEYLVLAKDADLVATKYAVPANAQIFAWGTGNLANGSEKIQLSKPGDEDDDERQWLRVDRVVYSDGSRPEDFPSGTDPWPAAADGQGSSLTRTEPTTYGNDPVNWIAASPSPGQAGH